MNVEIIPAYKDNYIYFLTCSKSGKTAVVDPGEAEPVIDYCRRHDVEIDAILITHHHWDHTNGIEALRDKFASKVYAPANEPRIEHVNVALEEGRSFKIGLMGFQVLETPGHTKSHICLYSESDRALFCGDTLFSIGCGRLFEGTAEQMFQSMQKIKSLPDDTSVYCGHEYTLANIQFAKTLDGSGQALVGYEEKVKAKLHAGQPSIPSMLEIEKQLNPFLTAADATELGRIREMKDNA